jgi:predicted ester cyclase
MDNKEIFRRYQTALRQPDMLAPLLAPDFIAHDQPSPNGRDDLVKYRRMVMAAFPDQSFEIMDIVVEGDRVAARLRAEQTHQGEFRGLPPTGKRLSFEVYEIAYIELGRISARWTAMKPGLSEILAELAGHSL